MDLSLNTDGRRKEISTCNKVLYSSLTASIWLFLFFADGRYLACALSAWEGVYAKSDTLGIEKWCKPTGNETSELESQQITLKWISISQILGFFIILLVVVLLACVQGTQRALTHRNITERECDEDSRENLQRQLDLKPEDKVMNGNSVCSKVLYSLLISFIWLFLFFFDGQYMACACSRWGGEYTETGALKWCKPKGNESEVFKRQQDTQRCMTYSQFAAFGIVLVITSIIGIAYCCRLHCCHVCCHGHCNGCFVPECAHCHNGGHQNGEVPMTNQTNRARGAGEAQ
ncbi:hypothetical protein KOW79_021631 [Hemibagrus wyckioides]|uniref:Uncharacterized protein n=1 Tax=Hemibagrus wyckioides TaxID=337641 RepID=A0A9D3SBX1_9TELE|nr:hypothetical protein KOW79_021631 [Hemibagrus wyckioides]